jgi:hypothetical protein
LIALSLASMQQAVFFILFVALGTTTVLGQISLPILEKVKTIKLLESTREDVEKLLARESFSYSSANDHYQDFWMEDVVVTIWYSAGTCEQEEYKWNDWKVPEWQVVRVLVSPKEDFSIKDISVDMSKFRKERTDWQRKGYSVYFDKTAGLAIDTRHDRVERIQFFPPKSNQNKLCESNSVRKYYASSRWMRLPDSKKTINDYNYPANVTDVRIIKVDDASNRFTIETVAKDPEGDILTFEYKTSAGIIIGTGPRVIWDLSGLGVGKYKISVGANDGCGFCGKIVTKSVTIQ